MNPIWPVPVEMLAQFIAYLSYKGLTASTVSTYISELSHVHKMNGLQDNTKFFFIRAVFERNFTNSKHTKISKEKAADNI
jgi:hypothetical protein